MKHPFLIFLLFLCGGFPPSHSLREPARLRREPPDAHHADAVPTRIRTRRQIHRRPTYFAYDRANLLPADRSSRVRELGGDRYEITTEALRIVYEHDGFPFGLHNFAAYYKLNGKEKKFTNRCIFRNNLAARSRRSTALPGDPHAGRLLSRDGWYVIDDERSDLLVDGWLCPRDTNSHVQDQYCFVYGNDYKAALADLGAISGRVPMTRKYIHGVWYCRYWDYTSEEFLSIIDGYEENDFPLDNLVFDMGWHTYTAKNGTGHAGSRSWTGYTWERKRIPDPGALIAEVHRRGVTVSLNDHPHDGIRPHEEMYAAFMADMGADPANPLLFDLGDRKYMETFFKQRTMPPRIWAPISGGSTGSRTTSIPRCAATAPRRCSGSTSLLPRDRAQRAARRRLQPLGGWGDHRHPIQFSGDAQANWEMLAFEVKLTAASGNAGCYYWAHDIGGFRGDPNPELTVRWTQFGASSAALRVHSTKDARLDRRPWISGERETAAMRRMYHMRSELMP